MPKGTQGVKTTQGGRVPTQLGPHRTNYTQDEMSAFERMESFGRRDAESILCRHCGRPIAVSGPHDKPDDNWDVPWMTKHEAHPRCDSRALKIRSEKQEQDAERIANQRMAQMASMSPEQRRAFEAAEEDPQEKLQKQDFGPGFYNEAGERVAPPSSLPQVVAPPNLAATPGTKPAPYKFRPGEMPLNKVKDTGLRNTEVADPKLTETPEEVEIMRRREEQDRQDFLRMQAEQEGK